MNAEEYLSRAIILEARINNELDRLAQLKTLAEKTTVTLTGMPGSPSKARSTLEDTMNRIIELEDVINKDVDRYVDIKIELRKAIRSIDDYKLEWLLELRFVDGKEWKDVATEMGSSLRSVYRMRIIALKKFQKIFEKIEFGS